jgi:hypothetical protein
LKFTRITNKPYYQFEFYDVNGESVIGRFFNLPEDRSMSPREFKNKPVVIDFNASYFNDSLSLSVQGIFLEDKGAVSEHDFFGVLSNHAELESWLVDRLSDNSYAKWLISSKIYKIRKYAASDINSKMGSCNEILQRIMLENDRYPEDVKYMDILSFVATLSHAVLVSNRDVFETIHQLMWVIGKVGEDNQLWVDELKSVLGAVVGTCSRPSTWRAIHCLRNMQREIEVQDTKILTERLKVGEVSEGLMKGARF